VLIVAVGCRGRVSWSRRDVAVVAGVCAGTVGFLIGAGKFLAQSSGIRVVPWSGGVMLSQIDSPASGSTWQVYTDPAVLGPYPGKELRRWLETPWAPASLCVNRASSAGSESLAAKSGRYIFFGDQAQRIAHGTPSSIETLVIIHPRGSPPSAPLKISGEVYLVLPEIDQSGVCPAWREWGQRCGARVISVPEVGTDIRWMWPRIAVKLGCFKSGFGADAKP
jgi:hypothetical protein